MCPGSHRDLNSAAFLHNLPSIYLPYVIQTGDFRAQASVHTQELLVEEGG